MRAALLQESPHKVRDELLKELALAAPIDELAPSSYWQLASELRHRGYLIEATDMLRKAQSAHPSDFWINYDLAMFEGMDRRAEAIWESIGFYRVALAIRPGDAATLTGLGSVLQAAGKLDEAMEYHQRAIDSNRQFAVAWNNLGTVLAAQHKLDDAINSYKTAIALAPEHPLAYGNLGEALRENNQLGDAIVAFEKSLALDSQNASVHNNFGIALASSGRMPDAVLHFYSATRFDSNNAAAFNNLGNALKATGELEEAAKAYRNAIGIDSNFIAAHSNLGNVLRAQGKLEEAIASWITVIRIASESPRSECIDAYNNLGVAKAREGHVDDAIDYWRTSHQLAPHNIRTREYLARGLLSRARAFGENGAAQCAIDDCREVLEFTSTASQMESLRQEAEQLLLQITEDEAQEPTEPGGQTELRETELRSSRVDPTSGDDSTTRKAKESVDSK